MEAETIHAKEDEIAGPSGAVLHRLLSNARLLLSDLHGAAADRSALRQEQGFCGAGCRGAKTGAI